MGKVLQIANRFKQAWLGHREWIKLSKRHGITGKTIVIMMPHADCGYNDIALKHLGALKNQRKADDVLVLSYDESILTQNIFNDGKNVKMIPYPYEKMKLIMTCYCLYKFYPYLYFVSLTQPNGNSGEELVGFNGITEEELIYSAVLRLPYRGAIV